MPTYKIQYKNKHIRDGKKNESYKNTVNTICNLHVACTRLAGFTPYLSLVQNIWLAMVANDRSCRSEELLIGVFLLVLNLGMKKTLLPVLLVDDTFDLLY